MRTLEQAALIDLLPRYIGFKVVPTLGGWACVEHWMPGSRAKARLEVLKAAGLSPSSQRITLNLPMVGKVDLTELRVERRAGAVAFPAIAVEDMLPTPTTSEQRAFVARLKAGVESGAGAESE